MKLNNGVIYRKDADILEFPESAVAVYVSEHGQMLFVRQFRHLHGRETIEVPGGRRQDGETKIDAARRELHEEAGFLGKNARLTASIDLDFSASKHVTHVVKFLNAEPRIQPHKFETLWIPPKDAMRLIEKGVITHAPTIVAVAWELIPWKD